MDVGSWLRSLGLGQYETAFRDNAVAATGALKLTVEKAFPLEEAAEAARASIEPGRTGKIAFRV
jgi:SAM domain (Sterile alpha motif)